MGRRLVCACVHESLCNPLVISDALLTIRASNQVHMHVTKKAQKPSEYVYARLSELVTKIKPEAKRVCYLPHITPLIYSSV